MVCETSVVLWVDHKSPSPSSLHGKFQMPTFHRPRRFPAHVYPHEAGTLVERLRRFIGHDRLIQQTTAYHAAVRASNGVRMARYREKQPLIEAFEAYEKSTLHRQRPLRSVDDELADLANVAAQCHVVDSTLVDPVRQHHREKLIDLNGQLKPLLLEWKTACHFVKTYGADIAWLPVNQSGPEFIASMHGIECEVECKRQTHMVIELLGQTEADILAGRIIDHVMKAGLRGHLFAHVPDDFDHNSLGESEAWEMALASIADPGTLDVRLPGGLHLEGEMIPADGYAIDVNVWQRQTRENRRDEARLYAQARAASPAAIDPVELQMMGPRRTTKELIEYLWTRKFNKAAAQCSKQRGAVLVFEWEDIADPSIFEDTSWFQDLLARTFDEHRHVAAIAMRCDSAPTRMGGLIDYATGAYLAKSNVTEFPKARNLLRLDG